MFEPEPFLSSLPYVRQEGGLRLDEENRTSWTPSSVSIHFGDRDDDLRVDRVEEFVHYVYWGRECRIHRVNESAERAVAFTGISIAVEDEPHGWRFAPPCTGGFTFGPLSVER